MDKVDTERLTKMMRAVMLVPGPDGMANAEVRQVPKPLAAAGEALVRVHAAGLNRGELLQRRRMAPGAPQPNGGEFAGEVVALGEGATGTTVGQRVMGHWRGAQAEYISVDTRLLVPIPDRVDWVAAGGWLNVYATAHDALVSAGRLRAGEAVLVAGAGSGVGVAALQIARLLGATPILGTSRDAAKLAAVGRFGLTQGFVPGPGLAAELKAATGGRGVDVLVDLVGAPVFGAGLQAMAVRGRYVSVGRTGGTKAELDLELVASQRLEIIGTTFRTRSKLERIAVVQAAVRDLLPALADGRLDPAIAATFPMEDIERAHAAMAEDRHVGKLVLTIA
jgi:NADPH2:quinone reductase